eukprot:Tbor_TRINITY_DN3643_c0_g1::TRINITY_DN3643_c0_g1_i1::g.310::m.310
MLSIISRTGPPIRWLGIAILIHCLVVTFLNKDTFHEHHHGTEKEEYVSTSGISDISPIPAADGMGALSRQGGSKLSAAMHMIPVLVTGSTNGAPVDNSYMFSPLPWLYIFEVLIGSLAFVVGESITVHNKFALIRRKDVCCSPSVISRYDNVVCSGIEFAHFNHRGP